MTKPPSRKPLSSRELLERIGCNHIDAERAGYADFCADLEEDRAAALIERYTALSRHEPLTPGMIVRWKPGLRNYRWPEYSQPAIVLEVLSEPILDHDHDAGSAYFRERLDLVLGLFIDKPEVRGDLLAFHYDSRRFQPWNATSVKSES